MTTVEALAMMNCLAADFKIGVVPETRVIQILTTLVDGLGVENRDEVLGNLLSDWGIEYV